jgi:hypothetical protein
LVYRLTGVPEDPDQDPVRAAWLQLGKGRLWEERVRAVLKGAGALLARPEQARAGGQVS